MNFELKKSLDILRRTPLVLDALLRDISDDWALCNEGEGTFSPFDVLGHLLHGEKTDWIPRLELILGNAVDKTFTPYDRFAQYEESKGKTLNQLLGEFKGLRYKNIEILESKQLGKEDLLKTARHPKFGEVTLHQLLSTWTIHDLSHLSQIGRVMCKHYKQDVGPWVEYMPILTRY